MKTKALDKILELGLFLVVATGFAHTWHQVVPPPIAGANAMSVDGRVICVVSSANHPYISIDSGKTWAFASNSLPGGTYYLGSVAISADGSKIFAGMSSNSVSPTWVFVTSDKGTNWTDRKSVV